MRAHSKEVTKFKRHCKKLGIPHQDVTREVMKAIVEGRFTIIKTETQTQALGALYK